MRLPKHLLAAMLAGASTISVQAQTTPLFIFSPGERDGLHVARWAEDGWHDMGQVCTSDYGTWGAEKRMHHPSVARATDGTWRLVFQVNDHSPVIAVAYSRDLVTWRPQDYPRMSTRKCLQPVVFENEDGSFDIYYRSEQGPRFVSATTDFRHFTADEPSRIGEAAWTRDTATIGGTLRQGNQFEVSTQEVDEMAHFLSQQREDARLSSERMHDDGVRLSSLRQPVVATLTVDVTREKAISDQLIGIFFEDISYAADGGLYAEMVQNRDFEYTSRDHGGWHALTGWTLKNEWIDTRKPLSENNAHYAVLDYDTLTNEGWGGMAVQAGELYDFSVYTKKMSVYKQQRLRVQLVDGNRVLARADLKVGADGWTQSTLTLSPKASAEKARLQIINLQKGSLVGIDMVSLFPRNTFKGRKNGLRKDLAETIAALHPKFVRFPGGCMSHGQGLDNIYHWSETIGPLQDRKPDMNIWHYHQTRGLGFYEYFQFCEDIGAEPLPVLAAGVPCQNSANDAEGMGGQQGGIPMADMPAYIDELLHLIEWANGDPATSEWARKRAEAGHPAPFHLKYLGIGNEDIISTVFEERYEMICRAIRQAYPEIKICGTVGPFHAPSADYIEGWDFTKKHPDLQYMTDEHYYESTGWFMHHRDYYDSYDRQAPKVYLGEWAASTKVKRPNVETALAEALYLTDIERNGDVVEMTSYAPMLCKDGHSNWNPNMIYFTNTTVRTTPAYHTQRLFSCYGGNRYVASSLTTPDSTLQHRIGASVVRDSKTGKTYLKMVNALPVELQLTLQGMEIPAGARGEQLSGRPEDQKAEPQPYTADERATVLPPYTLRVIEL